MTASTAPGDFTHEALFYTDPAECHDPIAAFLQAAVDLAQPTLIALDPAHPVLRQRGSYPDTIEFLDPTGVRPNPGGFLPHILLKFAGRFPGRPIRVLGELAMDRARLDYPARAQHEALVNLAFADRGGIILCLYDLTRQDPGMLADAERCHHVLQRSGVRRPSPTYPGPARLAAEYGIEVPDPPATATVREIGLEVLSELRWFVHGHATEAGLSEQRVKDLVFAVNELCVNTIEHSGGAGRLAVWADGPVFCQVGDAGHIADPLAGRIPVPPLAERGRGLQLVNHFCDLVEVSTRPGRTEVRVAMYR